MDFRIISHDPQIALWAGAAADIARPLVAQSDEAWRCGETWFVGVDALPNDATGAVGSVALPWQAFGIEPKKLHRAQVSVVRPDYPKAWAGESEAAFGYRLRRDAAHVDGLLGDGEGRRYLREPHAWILGLPLNDCDAGASPLVVWQGSVEIMRAGIARAFEGIAVADWPNVDITPSYQAARREVFTRCTRIEVPVRLGEATLLHRLCLHGVAPWRAGAHAPPEGRMIAYFRPELADLGDWISLP